MKLVIISHTEHYKTDSGDIVGLGSTITEINHLLDVFDTIYHVGMLHQEKPPPSALPYTSDKIKFIPLPPVGGPTIIDKFNIVINAPKILMIVKKAVRNADFFQFRAPTGIGVYVIPYLILFCSKKGWFKYAGNWKQKNAPIAYRFQRWLLKNQKRKVTINGKWQNQLKHCLTFENPCLTQEEVLKGNKIIKNKALSHNAINFCFVGRLEDEKGVGLLIDAFKNLNEDLKLKVNKIHIVGDGKAVNSYKNRTAKSDLNFLFHGFLSRDDVHNIYKESHAIVLPSASEGFPKVISEAMNYGCLPIVSNISSISNYVYDNENGFLFYPVTEDNLIQSLCKVLHLTDIEYSEMIQSKVETVSKFTYQYYSMRIKQKIMF